MCTLDEYLQIIYQSDLLTPDEENGCITVVQNKGIDCPEMQRLDVAKSRFILALAMQYKRDGTTFGELIEAGRRALRKAALKYNPEDSIVFMKFAVPFIREEMQEMVDVLSRNNRLLE